VKPGALAAAALVGLCASSPVRSEEAVESTCITCHSQEEDEALSAPVEEWRRSVHAEASVSCDSCHGGDPQQDDADLSMDEEAAGYVGSPGRKDVIAFCGNCHEQVAKGFLQSKMGRKSTEGAKVATCVTCHMTKGHAIAHPDPREILTETRCGKCHEGGRAIALRDSLLHLDGLIRRADAYVVPIRGAIDTSVLDEELRSARENAVVIAHSYDLARIQAVSKGTAQRLDRLKSKAERLESDVASRRRAGVGVVTFFLVACLATLRLSSNLRRRDSSHDGE